MFKLDFFRPFLAMARLVQARLCPFGLAKTLNFFRPFLAMARLAQARLCSFGLAKTLNFFRPFLAMARLAQARLCPFGLAKTSNFFLPFLASAIRAGSIALGLTKWLGCRSNKWVEKRSGGAARPSDQRFMRWFIRRVSFF